MDRKHEITEEEAAANDNYELCLINVINYFNHG